MFVETHFISPFIAARLKFYCLCHVCVRNAQRFAYTAICRRRG